MRSKYGAKDLIDPTPVFTFDTGAFFEIGNDAMDLMDLASASLQRQVLCGVAEDSEHLSVLKQSIRLRFAVALWKINARTMLDAAKMLSAGEVLEDVPGDAERGHGGSLIASYR